MNNPHLRFTGRPAYELPNLLSSFNAKTSRGDEMTEDLRDQADAIETHAINALDAIGDGIEAIGAAMFSAGTNKDWPMDVRTVAALGSLIKHLAVEQQYLRSVEGDMHTRIEMHDEKVKKGAK